MGRRRAERDARDAADASENAAAQPRLEAEATRIRREPTGHDAIGARIDAAQVRKRYAAAPAHAVWYESLPPCGCCPAETA
jgi:hypothetical protein